MVNVTACVGQNLAVGDDGRLQMAAWSVPRNVVDEIAPSGGDTTQFGATITLPGTLLIDKQVQWTNDADVDHLVRVEVTRRWKRWVTSNPNVIQFRDRWTNAITAAGGYSRVIPEVPVTAAILNGQCGSGGDIGTNSVAEPNPGKLYNWAGTKTSEEWISPLLKPGETISIWYQMYAWTPPPFADDANKNAPDHEIEAGWSRVKLVVYPQQGPLVSN